MFFRYLIKRLTPHWGLPIGRASERGLIRLTRAVFPPHSVTTWLLFNDFATAAFFSAVGESITLVR